MMKVLLVHNRYQQRGGEDAVVEAEAGLLASHGMTVRRFDADNDAIHGLRAQIQVSLQQFTGAPAIQRRLDAEFKSFRPDVVHVHNWFPTISPSIFRQCRRSGVPVVHTLHNYRLLCVGATFFRDGHVCEECLGSSLRAPGVLHGCYRGSKAGSAVATAGMLTHWISGTWHNCVDQYIALTEFARCKLIAGGLPEQRISVKPNFVDPDPGPGTGDGGYFLFAGRLTEEKGVRTLLECWRGAPDLPELWIAGDGPLHNEVSAAAETLPNVKWLGMKSSDEVLQLMRRAKATLCPSLWYEGMPRVVIESLAVGTPVIASRIGGYPEMLVDNESGLLFRTGDAAALRNRIQGVESARGFAGMRPNARDRYRAEYSGNRNFSLLQEIYGKAVRARANVSPVAIAPDACVS